MQSTNPHCQSFFSRIFLNAVVATAFATVLSACSGNLPFRYGETLCDSSNPCPAGFRCADSVCVEDNRPPPPEGDVEPIFEGDWDSPQGDADINVPPNFCRSDSQCQDGYACLNGSCTIAPCGGITCPGGQSCSYACIPLPTACDNIECRDESLEYCVDGRCVPTCQSDPCTIGGCTPGSPNCTLDPQSGKGVCSQSPDFTTCIGGRCVAIEGFPGRNCDAFCPEGFACSATCAADPCANNPCGLGWNCQPDENGNPQCIRNLCAGLTCGAGETCVSGRCLDTCADVPCEQGGRLCANGNVCCGPVGSRTCCQGADDVCSFGQCLPECTIDPTTCQSNQVCAGNQCLCGIDGNIQGCPSGSCCVGDGSPSNQVRCENPCAGSPCTDPANPICVPQCGSTPNYTCTSCGNGFACTDSNSKPNQVKDNASCTCYCGSSHADCQGGNNCCLPAKATAASGQACGQTGNPACPTGEYCDLFSGVGSPTYRTCILDFVCDDPCQPNDCPANARNCQRTCGTFGNPDQDGRTCTTFCTSGVVGGCQATYGNQTSCDQDDGSCVCGATEDECVSGDCCDGTSCHSPCDPNPCTNPSFPACRTTDTNNNRISCNANGANGGPGYTCVAVSCTTSCANPQCNALNGRAYCYTDGGGNQVQCGGGTTCDQANSRCVDLCAGVDCPALGDTDVTHTACGVRNITSTTCGAYCFDPCATRSCLTVACAAQTTNGVQNCAQSSGGRALTCFREDTGDADTFDDDAVCRCQGATSNATNGVCNSGFCCDDRGASGSTFSPGGGCYDPCAGNPCAGRGDGRTHCNAACNTTEGTTTGRNYQCVNPCNGNNCASGNSNNISPTCFPATDGGTGSTNNFTCGCGTSGNVCAGGANAACCFDPSGTPGTTNGYNNGDRNTCDNDVCRDASGNDVCRSAGLGACVYDCTGRVGGYRCQPACTTCSDPRNPTCNPNDLPGGEPPCTCGAGGTECNSGCCDTVGTGSLYCHDACAEGGNADCAGRSPAGQTCQLTCGTNPGYRCINPCSAGTCTGIYNNPDCGIVGGQATCTCNGTACGQANNCCVDGPDDDGVRDTCNLNPCSNNPCSTNPTNRRCVVECNAADSDQNGYRCDTFCTSANIAACRTATTGLECDPADGSCRCGSSLGNCPAAGTVGATQICCPLSDDYTCRAPASCAQNGCPPGQQCDPCGAGTGCATIE